jgi:hypothetical protein
VSVRGEVVCMCGGGGGGGGGRRGGQQMGGAGEGQRVREAWWWWAGSRAGRGPWPRSRGATTRGAHLGCMKAQIMP